MHKHVYKNGYVGVNVWKFNSSFYPDEIFPQGILTISLYKLEFLMHTLINIVSAKEYRNGC